MLVYLLAVRHTLGTDGAPNRTRTDTGRGLLYFVSSRTFRLSGTDLLKQLTLYTVD
jgi:hypothetical protein